MQCPRCSAIQQERRLTCRRCNAYLTSAEPVESPKSLGPASIVAIMLTLAGAGGYYFVMMKQQEKARGLDKKPVAAQVVSKGSEADSSKSKPTRAEKKKKRRHK